MSDTSRITHACGKAFIRNLPVTVSQLLEKLADDGELGALQAFPGLERDDISAALRYAANMSAIDQKTSPQGSAEVKPVPGQRLIRRFPDFFAEGEVSISIPSGWEDLLEKILRTFAKTGFKIRINSIYVKDGRLYFSESHDYSPGARTLDCLLGLTLNACMLCGRQVEEELGRISARFPLCKSCLEANGLTIPHVHKRPEARHHDDVD